MIHIAKIIAGLFSDSEHAGMAVSQLKEKGYTDSISVLAKDESGEVNSHNVKENVTDGAVGGAVTGGVLGSIAGLIAGLTSLAVPGLGPLIVAGPLAATWGLTGGAVGALAGGIVGALVDVGIPESDAKYYEERLMAGDVLVTVSAPDEKVEEVQQILQQHKVEETATA